VTVTIAIIPTEERQPRYPSRFSEEQTTLQPQSQKVQLSPTVTTNRRRVSQPHSALTKSRMILLIGLAAVIVLASLSFFFLTRNSGSPNPYAPYTGTLAIDDSFRGNTITWFQGTNNQGSCEFREGAYYLYTQQASYYFCTNGVSNFGDFAYQIQMTIINGNSGGMIFRSDGTAKNCYYFRIRQDGSYELDLVNNSSVQLLKSGSNPVINIGLNQRNEIAVVATGSTLDLYVNLHKIESVNDSTYTSGQIGVAVSGIGTPTEVAFNNAQVWKM
jgi:hypothetical protein